MQRKKIYLTLIILSVVLLIIIKSKPPHTSSIRITLVDLSTPILKSFNAVLSAPKRLIPFAQLRGENARLRDRLNESERKIEEMKALYYENQRLKLLLNFKESLPYETIPAQVIGRDPSNWSNSLIIDKGSSHGINKNRAVLSSRGLVGRLVEVGRRSSKILLITDPSSKVGVLIERNGQGGILVGRPDGRCRMIYIPLDSDVSSGDTVMTAGFGTIFPKGIMVGRVIRVGKEPGQLYKYAVVKPAQDLSKLQEVLCIR